MSNAELTRRVEALEAEMKQLRARFGDQPRERKYGWRHLVGSFAGDPLLLAAAKIGREYRESLRPKPKRRRDARS